MFDTVSKPQPSPLAAYLPALVVLVLAVMAAAGLYTAAELGHIGPAGVRSGFKLLAALTVGGIGIAAKLT